MTKRIRETPAAVAARKAAVAETRRSEPATVGLTDAQVGMLLDVREAGVQVYNGRAARTIEALEAAGLVTVDMELVPHHDGRWTERWEVTAEPPTLIDDGFRDWQEQ